MESVSRVFLCFYYIALVLSMVLISAERWWVTIDLSLKTSSGSAPWLLRVSDGEASTVPYIRIVPESTIQVRFGIEQGHRLCGYPRFDRSGRVCGGVLVYKRCHGMKEV